MLVPTPAIPETISVSGAASAIGPESKAQAVTKEQILIILAIPLQA